MSTVPVYPDALPIESVQNIAGLLKNGKVKENLPSFLLDLWWVWGFGQKMVVEVTSPNLFGGTGPTYPSALPLESVKLIANLVRNGKLKENVPEFVLHAWWVWGYSQKMVFGAPVPADDNLMISQSGFDPLATLDKIAAMDEDAVVSQAEIPWKELLAWLIAEIMKLVSGEVSIQSGFDATAAFEKLAESEKGVTAQVAVPWALILQWALAELMALLSAVK